MMNEIDLKLIETLITHDIVRDLPCTLYTEHEYELTLSDIEKLSKISSILSLSSEAKKQILAYEIITKLFRNFHHEYHNLYSITHAILSRLGNFPNRELLGKYGFSESNLRQSPIIKLEVIARQSENKVFIKNSTPLLTDFQKLFFDVLTKEKFYSISAPTSAGKSFIFTLSITQRLLKNPSEKIVFIVPTRALIRELSDKIIKSLKEYKLFNDIDIRTVPIIEKDSADRGVVYVLTQERLNTLLNEENIHLDTVFIDEAQEIQNNRGVVLQNTLEVLLKRFSNINIFFASPLIENPNYFNDLLELNHHQKYFVEEVSPVGQNIIFLSSIKREPKQAKVTLVSNDNNIDLGYLELDFSFRDSGQIIDLALSITKDNELTLIYCNKPTDTEKKATELAEKILDELHDPEINALIDFIKEDVHKDYSLINCLKKGVAYHYSHIPATLRSEIERLASIGKLKYIFCTSTLLQGVNLPTKNIILSNPSKGSGKPMQRSDFLNLIGRAGRLKHEFQGNIWCVEPSNWAEKSYEGAKLQKIESFYIKNLTDHTQKILDLAIDENSNHPDLLSVFGKFYSDYVIDNKSLTKYQHLDNFNLIEKIYEEGNSYKIELSEEIIKKHYTIHPKRLNALYNFFKQEEKLEDWLPKNVFIKKKDYPYEDGTYERLLKIFQKIDELILNRQNQTYTKYTLLAFSWIHDNLLHEIIEKNHDFNLKKEPDRTINTTIREVLEILESHVRFEYVVYTGAYLDILKYVIEEKRLTIDLEHIPNLPLHLECGSADPLVINLLSLGLSRLTSIKLKKSKFFSCDEPTATNCFKALQSINIDLIDMPLICKQEIKNLIL